MTTHRCAALAIACAAFAFAAAGCYSYDTCEGTVCGDACWVCSPSDDDCGSRPPDGYCDGDGSCKRTGFPNCP